MRFLAREPKFLVHQTVTLAKLATARYFKLVAAPGVRVFGRLGK